MNAVLHYLSHTSQYIQFHAIVLALILTGTFMILTASDLGVMAPLVISLGIYIVIFGVLTEMLLGFRVLITRIANRILVKKIPPITDTPAA